MGSSSAPAVTLCILACICGLQTVAMATKSICTNLCIIHYTDEIRGGPNNTFLLAVGAPQLNLSEGCAWGSFVVYDNMIKDGPNTDNKLLGTITGTSVGVVKPTTTSNGKTSMQLLMQHVFREASKYNGSTITVVGIFFIPTGLWEMIVSGATGCLRGYTAYGVVQPVSATTGPPPLLLVFRWDFYLFKYKNYNVFI